MNLENHPLPTTSLYLILSCKSLRNCSIITSEVRGHGIGEAMPHFLSRDERRDWISGGATSNSPSFGKGIVDVKINLQIFCKENK